MVAPRRIFISLSSHYHLIIISLSPPRLVFIFAGAALPTTGSPPELAQSCCYGLARVMRRELPLLAAESVTVTVTHSAAEGVRGAARGARGGDARPLRLLAASEAEQAWSRDTRLLPRLMTND